MSYVTPYSQLLDEGNWELRVPQHVQIGSSIYNFSAWSDGAPITVDPTTTEVVRTIPLFSDASVSFNHVLAPPVTHTLTINSSPVSGIPITVDGYQYNTPTGALTLTEGNHIVVAPSNILVGTDIYNFVQWEDNSTSPQRTINLMAATLISFTVHLVTPPPPAKGSLEIHAFLEETEVVAPYEVVGDGTGNTPISIDLDPATYSVRVTVNGRTITQPAEIISSQRLRLDFQFTARPVISRNTAYALGIGAVAVVGGIMWMSSGKKKKR